MLQGGVGGAEEVGQVGRSADLRVSMVTASV